MKLDLLNSKNNIVDSVELSDDIFGLEYKKTVINQYVQVYLSNQRQSNAHTKDRSEVRGGGKKPWKQKGTGRARFGSSRNPIWKGGGVVFGPTNMINYKKRLTKKFRKVAMKHALSFMNKSGFIKIVDSVSIDEKKPLTAQLVNVVKDFDTTKLTLITSTKNDTLLNASKNLEKVSVKNVLDLNTYDIIAGGVVLIELDAIKLLQDRLLN